MPKQPAPTRVLTSVNPKPKAASAPVKTDQLPTLADTEDAEFTRVMWYGHGGTWKTSNALDIARRGKTILVRADPGVKPKVLKRLGIPTDQIEVFEDITFDAMEDLYFDLKARLKDGEPLYAMVWDSITEIQNRFLDIEVRKQYDKATSNGKDRRITDVYVDEHGTVGQQIRMLIRKFHMLPLHWGVTALERSDQNENTGEVNKGPAVYPKVFGDLSGYFDMFVRTYVQVAGEDEQGQGTTRPVGPHYGKDRFGVLPIRLVVPTFGRIIDYVEGDLNRETDPLQLAARAAIRKGTNKMEESDAEAE